MKERYFSPEVKSLPKANTVQVPEQYQHLNPNKQISPNAYSVIRQILGETEANRFAWLVKSNRIDKQAIDEVVIDYQRSHHLNGHSPNPMSLAQFELKLHSFFGDMDDPS
jgi:hypothetical protein